jgi:phosphatidylserine/phosphatidylglycerophosphate/cardiolipin synthase-like enzyme/MFS family permease
MKTSSQSYSRNFWIGLAGFILGGIACALATYLLFASRVPTWIINLIPEEQPLVQLLTGILLLFFLVGAGGAIGGLVRGYSLSLVDPAGNPRRYLLGGAFSMGISQGILVAPIMLLSGIISLYNNGSPRDPASYIVFFTLVGGLFGLLAGGILSMATLRLRYALLAWLAYFTSNLAGGALLGVLVWKWEAVFSSVPRGFITLLFVVLAGITIYGLPGGLVGLIYSWLSRKRTTEQPQAITPRRWQDILTITVFSLLFLFVASFINQAADFVTKYTGSVTTNLTNPTQGIQWQESRIISNDVSTKDGSSVDISANPSDTALTWSNSSGEIHMAFLQVPSEGSIILSGPYNVSQGSLQNSMHPQVVLGKEGEAYIIWSDSGEIWYNRCQGSTCQVPVNLTPAGQVCPTVTSPAQNDWPAIALQDDGSLMAAWSVGGGVVKYTGLPSANGATGPGSGCISVDITSVRPRLATGSNGEFWMALSGATNSPGSVYLGEYTQGKWNVPQKVGQGSTADVFVDSNGKVMAAWCGVSQELAYSAGLQPADIIPHAVCKNRPSIFEDQFGQVHLVFGTDQWLNVSGILRQGSALMETIFHSGAWSDPSIIGALSSGGQQALAMVPVSDIQVAWTDIQDGNPILRYSTQQAYQCSETSLSEPMKSVLNVVENGTFHPAGYQSPFCGNQFEGFIFMPNPEPEFYTLPPGERIGYDQLAGLLVQARSEILFSNMQWDQDQDNLSPGSEMARTITSLYQQVKANPAAYPRGLSIKILLGNYPSVSTLQNGDQIWNVIQDFVDAGLPAMEDPSIGWKVELANYKGSMPHSHTKFLVLDGKTVMAAGFNIAWSHLPKTNPSGKGNSLTDLGIVLSGPVAQTGIAAFDDQWLGSNQLVCPDLSSSDLEFLEKNCTWQLGIVSHTPESLKFYLPGETADAVALYRTAVYKESDQAYEAGLRSAQSTIDIIHVNFTAKLICDLNVLMPDLCGYNDTLPYAHSIVDTMVQNGVHVRVITEGSNGNGLENLPNIQLLYAEAAKLGVSDQLEVRIFDGQVHTKSALIDSKLLFVGSQNFHYSSIYTGGVNEFVIATDSTQAIDTYLEMFEYYWQQAIPLDEWVIFEK